MKLQVPVTPNQPAWNRKAKHPDSSSSSSRNAKIAPFLPSDSNPSFSLGKIEFLPKSLNSIYGEAFAPSQRASLDFENRGGSHDLTPEQGTENEGEETSVDVIALVKESVQECKRSVKNIESLSAEIKINNSKNEQIFWAKLQAGISLFVILPLLGLGLKAGIMFFCGKGEWISHGFVPT